MKTAEQQMAVIEEMIAASKGNLSDGSVYYLLWGWAVLICAISNYALLNMVGSEYHWLPWPIGMTLAGFTSMFISIKQSKEKKANSYIERMLGMLWLSFIITLFVILFGMVSLGYEAVYPILMALYGLGTFASGGILKFKPLMIGGICSWACACVAYYVGFSDQLILISIAILTSYIIPGHMLAAKKN